MAPRDHLPEYDVSLTYFLDPEVGAGRVSYRHPVPVAGIILTGEAARHPKAGVGLMSWHSTYTSGCSTNYFSVGGVIRIDLRMISGDALKFA